MPRSKLPLLTLLVAAAMLPVVPILIAYWLVAKPWRRPLRAEPAGERES